MKAVIPTGGRGTRMQPITFSANKHFIPVGQKPLIFYPIETIADVGIREVAITYNPGWLDFVKSYLGDGSKWGLKLTYVLQEKPIGLANIFQVCEEFLNGDSFVFHLGDNIFTQGIKDGVDYFLKQKPNGLVYMVKHPENSRMGVPYFNKSHRLVRYVEKPKAPPHSYAIPGIYFLDKNAFKCFKGKDKIKPSDRGEYEIPTVYQWLIDHDYRVDVIEYKGKWLDPGKFGDWIESNQYLLDNNIDTKIDSKLGDDTIVEGRVSIGKKCNIKYSEIRGPVAIGDKVVIKDSYIGPFTSISDNCIIENSHIENSVLMAGVNVSGVKPIDKSLIGSGAQVMKNSEQKQSMELFVGEKSVIKL